MKSVEVLSSQDVPINSSKKWFMNVLSRIAPYCVILAVTYFLPDSGVKVNGGQYVHIAGTGYKIDNGGYANLSNGAVIRDNPVIGEAEVMNPEGDVDGTDLPSPRRFSRAQVNVSYNGK